MRSAHTIPTQAERQQAAEIARLYREAPDIADLLLTRFLTVRPAHMLSRRVAAVIHEASRIASLH